MLQRLFGHTYSPEHASYTIFESCPVSKLIYCTMLALVRILTISKHLFLPSIILQDVGWQGMATTTQACAIWVCSAEPSCQRMKLASAGASSPCNIFASFCIKSPQFSILALRRPSPLCPAVALYYYLSVSLSLHISLYISLSLYLSISLSLYLSIDLSL